MSSMIPIIEFLKYELPEYSFCEMKLYKKKINKEEFNKLIDQNKKSMCFEYIMPNNCKFVTCIHIKEFNNKFKKEMIYHKIGNYIIIYKGKIIMFDQICGLKNLIKFLKETFKMFEDFENEIPV